MITVITFFFRFSTQPMPIAGLARQEKVPRLPLTIAAIAEKAGWGVRSRGRLAEPNLN
jgi:hypothetical protein